MPLRLPYLDGLRALAALYVVLFHVMLGFSSASLVGRWRFLRRVFAYGHEAVAIFIVLSGYCLMLPVIRKSSRELPTEFGRFMRRRAQRILPPYFIALGVSLAIIALVAPLRVPTHDSIWDDSLPGLDAGAITSHVLLLHNWFPAYKQQINGPLWSVATEWQIYFFFPLLLLPVWRRVGMAGALFIAAACAYLPLVVTPVSASAAVVWYLLLFAFGMAAAAVGFANEGLAVRLREKVPWGVMCAACWFVCVVFSNGAAELWFGSKPFTDPLVGLASATLLIYLSARAVNETAPRGWLLSALESRPLVAVGHFSYSLYLTHLPILALTRLALVPLGLPPLVASFVLLAVGGALSIGFAYVFYLGAERPFLLRR